MTDLMTSSLAVSSCVVGDSVHAQGRAYGERTETRDKRESVLSVKAVGAVEVLTTSQVGASQVYHVKEARRTHPSRMSLKRPTHNIWITAKEGVKWCQKFYCSSTRIRTFQEAVNERQCALWKPV
ncbi:hypothetical protein WMY93_013436 [Mugilogobius chulae]|uniref:Secreted protein n=1 Tax=Mugilogobius chulae TaxID=88201 RepID=A0AAW0P3L9_9GOBI